MNIVPQGYDEAACKFPSYRGDSGIIKGPPHPASASHSPLQVAVCLKLPLPPAGTPHFPYTFIVDEHIFSVYE